MFDQNKMFSDAQVVAASGDATNDLDVGKTPAEGVPVEVVVSAVSGTSPTLNVTIQESDDDSTYTDLVKFPQITAVGRHMRLVQSAKRYLRADYVVGGTTPSFTITAGIVSGFHPDQVS